MLHSTSVLTPAIGARGRDLSGRVLPADMRHFTRTEPVYSPTPLHDAVQSGDIDAVEQAIAGGADVNAKTLFALTPLHIAARLYGLKRRQDRPAQRWATIVELLLAAGADPTAEDFQGSLPAKWCEGFQPPALRARMLALAQADQWQAGRENAPRNAGRRWRSHDLPGIKVPLDRGGGDEGFSPTNGEDQLSYDQDTLESTGLFGETAGGIVFEDEEAFPRDGLDFASEEEDGTTTTH